MDASGFLPAGVPSNWVIYFGVEDAYATAAKAVELGGTALRTPEDTPHGRNATLADPHGAIFIINQALPREGEA